MQAKLIRTCRPTSRTDPALITYRDGDTRGIVEAGQIIDDPDAFALVQYGQAEPHDEECRAELKKRGWKPHMLAAAVELQDKRQQGIRDAIAAGGDVVNIDELFEEASDESASSDE